MTVEEIFKDNKHLLDEPEVKNLINYVKVLHLNMIKDSIKTEETLQRIRWAFLRSELFLIDGIESKKALKEIGEILNAHDQ